MGRKPSRWSNLPPGMRARPRGNLVHYYLDTGGRPRKEIPLGSDFTLAVQKWAELTSQPKPAGTDTLFSDVVTAYKRDVLPTKAVRTRADNEREFVWLLKFFNDPPAPLDSIEPQHVRQYMRWRVKQAVAMAEADNAERQANNQPALPVPPNHGHVRANREKALLSHVWNYARGEGLTKLPNPCAGIKSFTEEGRDTAPDADLLARVVEHASEDLRFALRLADITGQRPADVLRMSEQHIQGDIPGGELLVRQGKTRIKLRIAIEGALADLLSEIQAYKQRLQAQHKVYAMALLVNERGQPMSKHMLRDRFDAARAAAGVQKDLFQFRDLRAKAGTELDEAGGTRAAQAILGHTTEGTTVRYIRRKAGRKVSPVR